MSSTLHSQARDPNITSAEPVLSSFRGLIPLYFRGDIASDLEYEGEPISPSRVFQLKRAGLIDDISRLEPLTSVSTGDGIVNLSDYTGISKPGLPSQKALLEYPSVEFLNYRGRMNGEFQVAVKNREGKIFHLGIGPRAVNSLMNRVALHKLGYQVSAGSARSLLRIEFSGVLEKRRFFLNFTKRFAEYVGFEGEFSPQKKKYFRNLILSFQAFISDSMFSESNFLEVSNPVVFEPPLKLLNLSTGIAPEAIEGRRKYSSLQLVYAMFDLPESLNLFPYSIGTVQDRALVLDYNRAADFATNFEDARWMARKIAKWRLRDFEDIASATEFPPCYQKLLVQILISRRNGLVKHLDLEGESSMIHFDRKLNCGGLVKEGIAQEAKIDGFGNRFTHERYEGPLVGSEIWALVKSVIFSNVISNAVFQVNKELPSTDISNEVNAYKFEQAAKQFAEFIQTGELGKTEFNSFPIPYTRFGVNYSRALVAGPYLGTNNTVQMVESLGFSLGLGNYYGFDGTHSRDFLSAKLGISYRFSLSHIQPIQIDAPKKIGEQSDVKGAFEKAFEKQSSELFELLSMPFEAMKAFSNYSPLSFDPLSMSSPEVRAFIAALDKSDKDLSAQYRAHLYSLIHPKSQAELKTLRESDLLSSIKWNDVFKGVKENFLEELALINSSNEPKLSRKAKRWSAGMMRSRYLLNLDKVYKQKRDEEFKNFDTVVESFLKEFKVGDSVIAHHHFDSGLSTNAAHALTSTSAWFLDLSAGKNYLFRTHMTRVSETEFQIYRSIADKGLYGFVVGLRLYLRFAYAGSEWSAGEVMSRLYRLHIKRFSPPGEAVGPATDRSANKSYLNDNQIFEKMAAIKDVLYTGSLEKIKKIAPPVRVNHKFDQVNSKWGLLWWRGDHQQTFHSMKVVDTENLETQVVRYTDGYRVGAAYQDIGLDYANVYIKEHSDKEIKLAIPSNDDPGKSFFGYSKYLEGSIEALISEEGNSLENQCFSLRYRWNQFISGPEELREELNNYKNKFGMDLARMEPLYRSEQFDIFSFQTSFNLYDKSLEHIRNLEVSDIASIIDDFLVFDLNDKLLSRCEAKRSAYKGVGHSRARINECHYQRVTRLFHEYFLKMKHNISIGTHRSYMKSMTDFLHHAQKYLKATGFHKLVGGPDKFFMVSRLDAYRKGDEVSEPSVLFDSYGTLPGLHTTCPIRALASQYNYSEAELFLFWWNSRL